MTKNKFVSILVLTISIMQFGCNKTPDTSVTASGEDSSASGAAASSVGGAISGSTSSGAVSFYQAPKSIWQLIQPFALAAVACPKLTSANGTGCTNAGNAADLTYSNCMFGSAAATWNGIQEVTLASGAVTCGTFPTPTSNTLQRQFVTSAGVPGTVVRTSAAGTAVSIDNQTINLSNFDNQTITTNVGTGYGTKVTFDGTGARTAVAVKERVYTTNGFDHTVAGSVSIAESGTTRTVTGSTTVFHNKIKVVGTSTFNSVIYNNTSCAPVGGSITTTFAAGINVAPTTFGAAVVGKSETLTFNADGTATLSDTATGSSATVKMAHCL